MHSTADERHRMTTPQKSRKLPVTVGAVLATVGSLIAIGGAGTLAVAGSDGTISTSHHNVSTPTTALVSETAKITDTSAAADALGHPRIRIDSTADQGRRDVFVGVGPAKAVDQYLAGASIDKVGDISTDPFKLETQRRDGSATPTRPADQSFWVSQSSGHNAKLDWKVRDGDYRFVVMNADGSPRVATSTRAEVEIPYLSTIALTTLLAGFVMLAGGIVLMVPRGGGGSQAAAPAPVPEMQAV
jgi:hypothetical protein